MGDNKEFDTDSDSGWAPPVPKPSYYNVPGNRPSDRDLEKGGDTEEDERGPPPEYRGQEDEDEEDEEEKEKGKGKKLSGTWICVIANLAILIVVIIVVTLLVIFLLRGQSSDSPTAGEVMEGMEGMESTSTTASLVSRVTGTTRPFRITTGFRTTTTPTRPTTSGIRITTRYPPTPPVSTVLGRK